MTTEDFIIELFCRVDDIMLDVKKHPQAALCPSEVVTLALLFALKGLGNRAFYRWLKSILTLVCHFKKVMHRVWAYFISRLGYTMALFNLLVQWLTFSLMTMVSFISQLLRPACERAPKVN